MPSVTKVLNIRTLLGDPKKVDGLVYVGRRVSGRGRQSWPESPYHNPFRPSTTGDKFRDALECVILFADAIRQRCEKPTYLAELRRKLKGKYLACWCCDWTYNTQIVTPCHAIPLACVAEGNEPALVVESLRQVLAAHKERASAWPREGRPICVIKQVT